MPDAASVTVSERALRGLGWALGGRDPHLFTACFAGRPVIVAPEGRFVGAAEILGYWSWVLEGAAHVSCGPHRIGVWARGSQVVCDCVFVQVSHSGVQLAVRYVGIVEVDEFAEISRLDVHYDRWDLLRQVVAQTSGSVAKLVARFVTSAQRFLEPT